MEPVTLTAVATAIATIVLTKALKKTGEKLGEAALDICISQYDVVFHY